MRSKTIRDTSHFATELFATLSGRFQRVKEPYFIDHCVIPPDLQLKEHWTGYYVGSRRRIRLHLYKFIPENAASRYEHYVLYVEFICHMPDPVVLIAIVDTPESVWPRPPKDFGNLARIFEAEDEFQNLYPLLYKFQADFYSTLAKYSQETKEYVQATRKRKRK